MLLKNSDKVMTLLSPADKVLDIGGWGHPFNRANWVMDREPYETRGYYNRAFARNNPLPPIGGTVEHFTKDTWIQRDICSGEPYPFGDKELDFVICSHTLEDVRDPLRVCSEMIRIARAGYIEIPSRVWETCRGQEPKIAGLSHHRWLVEVDGNNIRFLQKFHSIHRWRFSLPKRVLTSLSAEESVTWLFWHNTFDYEEIVLHGNDQVHELERFVTQHHHYPRWLLRTEDAMRASYCRMANAKNRLLRLVGS